MDRNSKTIRLRGVRVNNLRSIDLDIPHGQWVALCGLSGSGKSSFALDTLYAEGQRRYIESFSAYTRQFLAQIERPNADSIDGVPPAVAIRAARGQFGKRATLGTTTETVEYVRLLFSKLATIVCFRCGTTVQRSSVESIEDELSSLPSGTRFQLGFPLSRLESYDSQKITDEVIRMAPEKALLQAKRLGFVRAIVAGKTVDLSSLDSVVATTSPNSSIVVVDRLLAGRTESRRLRDSMETAFQFGGEDCVLLIEGDFRSLLNGAALTEVDGQVWTRINRSRQLKCSACGELFLDADPRLFSFNDSAGACRVCEGLGEEASLDMRKIVPDENQSLRGGAIVPWNSRAYAHEFRGLLALADDFDIPVDVPFSALSKAQIQWLWDGVPERKFGGLRGFFDWLERRKYKLHLRVFLSRWKTYRECTACGGNRLDPHSLSHRLGGLNIAEFCNLTVDEALSFCRGLSGQTVNAEIARPIQLQLESRLNYLSNTGLGYLPLSRPMQHLSRGEIQRARLTSSLSSTLVNLLYVLDEPSFGLHPADIGKIRTAISQLHRRGNTIVTIEHVLELIQAADRVIEIGPGSGQRGGRIVFDGTNAQLLKASESITGQFLRRERGNTYLAPRVPIGNKSISLEGASGLHLKDITVKFPLSCLCVVVGVSGAGKSTLVERTLFPAIAARKNVSAPEPLPFTSLRGDQHIDSVQWVDQTPLTRSTRSNPVTYIKSFDEIRRVYAETSDAKSRNLTAGHFSFNIDGGRCPKCVGQGELSVDMQFLADIRMKCDECNGLRYRQNVLQVKYRGKTIAETLEMTVGEAFGFFRGQRKLQKALKLLMDVGLEYLRLGQSAATMSSGESQRLKLAAQLSSKSKRNCLYVLDQPCAGLHPDDVVRLVDCFQSLLAVGHSLIVIEHRLQLMLYADWIIEMGPGAGSAGGNIVACGTPEELAKSSSSVTAPYLKPFFSDV